MKPTFKIALVIKQGSNVSEELHKYEVLEFPGGEVHVKVDPMMTRNINSEVDSYEIIIVGLPKKSSDIMELVLLKNALDNLFLQIEHVKLPIFTLALDYLPYARQDRVANKGEENGVKVIADILNLMNFHKVLIQDPHSHVPLAVIKNVKACYPRDDVLKLMKWELKADDSIGLIIPDNGATHRVLDNFGSMFKTIVQFTKERNPETGKLTNTKSYELQENYEDVEDFYIIDDICDGGRTFIEIAKVFRAKYKGKAKLHLIVTNGIFSKGKEVLYEYFDSVQAVFDWTKEDNER